jgi:hypothetical protein
LFCLGRAVQDASRGKKRTCHLASFGARARNRQAVEQEGGTFGATIGWQPLTGKFIQEEFEGTFKASGCVWKMLLKRTK